MKRRVFLHAQTVWLKSGLEAWLDRAGVSRFTAGRAGVCGSSFFGVDFIVIEWNQHGVDSVMCLLAQVEERIIPPIVAVSVDPSFSRSPRGVRKLLQLPHQLNQLADIFSVECDFIPPQFDLATPSRVDAQAEERSTASARTQSGWRAVVGSTSKEQVGRALTHVQKPGCDESDPRELFGMAIDAVLAGERQRAADYFGAANQLVPGDLQIELNLRRLAELGFHPWKA